MRSLQIFFVNAITLIIGLSLMSGSFSSNKAQAAPLETVPKIQIHKIGNYKGQYLTAFYALGTRPFLSTDSSQVILSEIKAAKTELVTADSLTLPAVDLQKIGFRPPYNLVMIVVSPAPDFTFVNPDSSIIKGMNQSENHRATLIRSFSKVELDSLATGEGSQREFVLTLD
ncbi:MAG TPA: hypothetical protein VIG33_16895 [Pseudobdellovibrionaceae bacterium]|jgi:regulator of extracellular matrix RemA (YlzA/DUF370 family)